MRDSIELSKRNFYIMITLCGTIIMMASLEAILMIKDSGMFEVWKESLGTKIGDSTQDMYSVYLTMCLSIFFIKIITPVSLGIYTYLALIKLRISKLFVQTWVLLSVGLFIFVVLMEKSYSIFFIATAISYVLIVVMLIYFWVEINRKKNEQILESIQR
ncbi:MAG: hypothetical protein ACRDAU_13870 [Clostridium sp.]